MRRFGVSFISPSCSHFSLHLTDNLVRLNEQGLWNRDANRTCSPRIDGQCKLRGLLNGQITWFRALQNTRDVAGRTAKQRQQVWPVPKEASCVVRNFIATYRRKPAMDCQRSHAVAKAIQERVVGNKDGIRAAGEGRNDSINLL